MSSQTNLISIVQMCSTPDPIINYNESVSLIEKAAKGGAKMVFLPEAFDVIGSTMEELLKCAQSIEGETISNYRSLAKKLGVWLSLGGFHEKPSGFVGRFYNSHLIIDDCGAIKEIYRKLHLFDVDIKDKVSLKESDFTKGGMQVVPPVSSPIGKIGLSICYDLRFPELSNILTNMGAEILTYPSAFTVPTGMAHWHTLLRSRAIENQCYVIAAAQCGQHHAKRSSYGHSVVIDPWGCVIAECSDGVGICTAEINLNYMENRRRQMPLQAHRRRDVYTTLLNHSSEVIDSNTSYQFGQHTIPSCCVFYKSKHSYATVNKKCVLPGHVLVCPIRCTERFSSLSFEEVSDLFNTVQMVSKVLEKVYEATSVTISLQDGKDAGQTVKHVHVHVLPRKPGDFQKNDDIYDKLEHHDKYPELIKWREEEDMSSEALILRPFFQLFD